MGIIIIITTFKDLQATLVLHSSFSAPTPLVGRQEEHPVCKTRSSADSEKPCATRYHPEERYLQLVGHCTAVSYVEGIMYWQASTALPLLGVFIRPNISKSTQLTGSAFPLKFRNNNVVLENHSGRATRPRKSLMIS